MSSLEDLQKELYKKETEEVQRRMEKKVTLEGEQANAPPIWSGVEKKQAKISGKKISRGLAKMFWGIVVMLIIVLGALGIFLYLGTAGQEVEITIHGRESIESGEMLTVPILIRNVSHVKITDVELNVILPEGSIIREGVKERRAPLRLTKKVEDIGAGEDRVINLKVRMFGKRDERKLVEVTLLYRPENLSARFSVQNSKVFEIERVPLAVFWESPDYFTKDQEVEIVLHYSSNARSSFENVSIRIDYPDGFEFSSADPSPDESDNIWNIGTLDPGSGGAITIRGIIKGKEREVKSFRAELGSVDLLTQEWTVFNQISKEIKLEVVPLSIEGSINTSDNLIIPGSTVSFILTYKNNTNYPLENVSIFASVEGSIILPNTLSIRDGGILDYGTKEIVWGPGSTPKLRKISAGESGSVGFTIATRSTPPMKSDKDKHLTVKLYGRIEAQGIPPELIQRKVGSQDMREFKVKSKTLFAGRALYYLAPIPNNGPLPPQVGQKTTYNIVWEIRTFNNDIKDIVVNSSLPTGVRWEGNISPEIEQITYDSASKELYWRISEVPAATGVLKPAKSIAFQVSITPSEIDVGKTLVLINRTIFQAVDAFTGEKITIELDPITTRLEDDPMSETKDWAVVE